MARDRALWRQRLRARPSRLGPLREGRARPRTGAGRSISLHAQTPRSSGRLGFSARQAVPAVPLEGVPVPRRDHTLGMRPGPGAGGTRRGAGQGAAAFPGRSGRQPAATSSARVCVAAVGAVVRRGRSAVRRRTDRADRPRVEWAVAWLESGAEPALASFCNTIPTPQGGTHETGFRNALLKGLRNVGRAARSNKRAAQVTAEDLLGAVAAKLSAFIREPQFQGQTKEKLTNTEATRLVETALRDRFDHWLAGHPAQADALLAAIIERAEDRHAVASAEQGHATQERHPPPAPARQAHRLHARERGRNRDLPRRGRQRRRLGQAGAQPRNPGGAAACAARS